MPEFISKEQAKAMVRDGLEKMRREGNPMLVQMDQLGDEQEVEGPQFDKGQRTLFNSICEVATYELADHNFEAWEQALAALKELMIGVGFTQQNVMDTWLMIEQAACELAQEPELGKAARQWKKLKSSRIITGPLI